MPVLSLADWITESINYDALRVLNQSWNEGTCSSHLSLKLNNFIFIRLFLTPNLTLWCSHHWCHRYLQRFLFDLVFSTLSGICFTHNKLCMVGIIILKPWKRAFSRSVPSIWSFLTSVLLTKFMQNLIDFSVVFSCGIISVQKSRDVLACH